jgi:hypothetical protein
MQSANGNVDNFRFSLSKEPISGEVLLSCRAVLPDIAQNTLNPAISMRHTNPRFMSHSMMIF